MATFPGEGVGGIHPLSSLSKKGLTVQVSNPLCMLFNGRSEFKNQDMGTAVRQIIMIWYRNRDIVITCHWLVVPLSPSGSPFSFTISSVLLSNILSVLLSLDCTGWVT